MHETLNSIEFKSLMHDYDRFSQEINDQPIEKHHRHLLEMEIESACKELLNLHNRSPSAFAKFLADTEFELAQISKITKAIHKHSGNLDAIICNLFNANAMETPILKYPPNEHLLITGDQPNSRADYKKNDSFVTYLTNKLLPGMTAKQIAQLGFYQEHLLEHDLQNPRFNEIYQEAIETGEIKDADTKYCRDVIQATLRNHHNRLQFYPSQNNDRICTDAYTSSIEHRSNSANPSPCNFDAWGLHEMVLYVYCITPQYDFASTREKTEKAIQEIVDGIENKKLTNVSDFKITTACSTIFNSNHPIAHPLKSAADKLLKDGLTSILDYNALKFVEVDKEIIQIIATTPTILYNKLEGKMHFGFHSDKSPNIILKDLEIQIASSTDRLARAVSLASLLMSSKSISHEGRAAFVSLIASMIQTLNLALYASKRHQLENNKINEMLFTIEADLSDIQNTLVADNHL